MSAIALSPEKIRQRGMEALSRELGAVGMVQFMQQFSSGHGDYSKDRHKILDSLSVDEIWPAMTKKTKPERD